MGIKNMQGVSAYITRLPRDYSRYYKACCPNFENGFCTLYAEYCSQVTRCSIYIKYSDNPQKAKQKYDAKFNKNIDNKRTKKKKNKNTKNKLKNKVPANSVVLNHYKNTDENENMRIKSIVKSKRNNKKKNINTFVKIGSKVKLIDTKNNEVFSIILSKKRKGNNCITLEQPLGKAVINKKCGDIIELQINKNITTIIKILEIT